jgi:hypothetical protein
MRGATVKRSLRVFSMSALVAIVVVGGVEAAVRLAASGPGQIQTVPSLGTQTPGSASSGSLATWRAAVACARQHGMPGVPDPVLGANGKITIPGGTPTPTPAVQSACARQIRAVAPNFFTLPNVSDADIRALLRWAACIRAHGLLHWPDPNPQGVFHVRSANAGTEVTYERANAACRSLRGGTLAREDITPSGQ